MIRAGATSRSSIDHDAAVRAAVQEARDPRKTRIERRLWMRARDVSHSAQYLLEHVSESIRRFVASKERSTGQTRRPTYPLVAGSSQDIECTGVTSPVMSISQKSAIHAIRVGFGLIRWESDWLVLVP